MYVLIPMNKTPAAPATRTTSKYFHQLVLCIFNFLKIFLNFRLLFTRNLYCKQTVHPLWFLNKSALYASETGKGRILSKYKRKNIITYRTEVQVLYSYRSGKTMREQGNVYHISVQQNNTRSLTQHGNEYQGCSVHTCV